GPLDGRRPHQATGIAEGSPHRVQGPRPVRGHEQGNAAAPGHRAGRGDDERRGMMTSETRQLPDGAVVGVVVTRHRRELLADSLKIIAAQTRPVDHLVVVDNGPDDSAREVVENYPLPHTYLPSHRNLGGAGGFALGML